MCVITAPVWMMPNYMYVVQRSLDSDRHFNRIKTPRNESWSISDEGVVPDLKSLRQSSPRKSRPVSPVRDPLSPRVKKMLKETMQTQPLSPRSPRNNYKPQALDEDWTPTVIHGGFSKSESWVYVSRGVLLNCDYNDRVYLSQRETFGKKYFLSSNVMNNSYKKKWSVDAFDIYLCIFCRGCCTAFVSFINSTAVYMHTWE